MADELTPKVDPEALEEIIQAAGLKGKAAEALRNANTPSAESAEAASSGHGAPAEVHENFGEL